MIKGLQGTEIGEVFVVGKDLYQEQGPMEIVSPGFQGTNNSEEFSVIDVIVVFCRREQLEKIGARVPFAIQVSLEEDSAKGILGCIGGNGKQFGKVGEVKDRAR